MARIRSVHPSLFTDEAWVSCTPMARLLYIGLWTDADDQGLFEWKPLQIKMRILPADVTPAQDLLQELASVDLIIRFETGGASFGAIKNFRKFQRPKKPNATYDLPEHLREYVAIDDDDDPTSGLRKELCEEQGGRCFYCATDISHYSKRHNSLDIDHRIPTSRGGLDERHNLVAACRACNRGKCDRSEAEWRAILKSRVANDGVARAKPELAPQMEDGGGRGREEANNTDSAGATTSDRPMLDGLEAKLREAAGAALNAASPKLMVVAPILGLMRPGAGPACDLEADVIPAVRASAARAKPGSVRTWDYFTDAIAEARDQRLTGARAAPAGRRDVSEGERLDHFRSTGMWKADWGPRPEIAA